MVTEGINIPNFNLISKPILKGGINQRKLPLKKELTIDFKILEDKLTTTDELNIEMDKNFYRYFKI